MLAVDSDIMVALLRGREACFRHRFNEARLEQTPLMISTVVVHELATGAVSSQRPARHLEALAELMEAFEVLELSGDDAIAAAEVRAQLARTGTPIGALDTLIAGQALARNLTLVTSNVRHFGRVAGLRIIDWARGAELLTAQEISERVR